MDPVGKPSPPGGTQPATGAHAWRGPVRLICRTAVKAWDDSFVSMSAQAAFWMTLSLPPLLLGMLGSLGFVAGWFGPATIEATQREIVRLSSTVFSPDVVNQIIRPTVTDILTRGHSSIVSIGFLISLWAGSSALASLVDSITAAYRQYTVRHPVWQRIFALLLYVITLIGSVLVLPLIALGPDLTAKLIPDAARSTVSWLVGIFYYPGLGVLLVTALATLYKVVLPHKLPWHRGLPGALLAMVVFLVTSTGLRHYISWVSGTGYTYGALATPIAYLLFCFFIAMAILLGAEFNSAIEELWPAPVQRERRRWRRWLRVHVSAIASKAGASKRTAGPAHPAIPTRPSPAEPSAPASGRSPS